MASAVAFCAPRPLYHKAISLSSIFFKKNKKERELFFPALTPQKSSLENRNTKKDKSKAIRRPLLKQPISAERLNIVNVGNIRGFVGEHRAQNSNNLFHFYFFLSLGLCLPLNDLIISRGRRFVKHFFALTV